MTASRDGTAADSTPAETSTGLFPAPVPQAEIVDQARQSRLQEMQSVALIGIGVRLVVIIVEAIALCFWSYAALLTDLVASVFDVASSLALLVAIRYAARPPDDDHPFGHGRIEPLAGLQMGILLVCAGGWLGSRYFFGLITTDPEGEVASAVFLIPLVAAAALELVARLIHKTGERQQSSALIAESGHYRVDALTSLIAAFGLGAAALLPGWGHRIDLLSAISLALVMIGLGAGAAWQNLHQILDRVPHDEHFEQVKASALKAEGVLGVEKIRIQQAGPDAHVDIDIEVNPQLSVDEAHVITQHVRAQIQTDWPMVREVVVHVEPYYANDH